MKKLFLLLIPFVTLYSHSQVPTVYGGKNNKLETISTRQYKTIPIIVQNLNSFPQKYSISVDGKEVWQTPSLSKNESKRLDIVVKIKEPNKLELHKVCSTSIARDKKEMFNTKVCTKAYLYWAKK